MILSPCRLPARRHSRPRGAVGAEDDRDRVGRFGWLRSLELIATQPFTLSGLFFRARNFQVIHDEIEFPSVLSLFNFAFPNPHNFPPFFY